jgi:hypothetical protein
MFEISPEIYDAGKMNLLFPPTAPSTRHTLRLYTRLNYYYGKEEVC